MSGDPGNRVPIGKENVAIVPKIASRIPGFTFTKTACVTDAIVVTTDTEKSLSKRERNAGTQTPLTI